MATISRGWNGGFRRAGKAVLHLYPKGFSLLWLAPVALALVVGPEFLQHVGEIRLGMFDSREAFGELQADRSRMAFGFAKITGLFLAFLATARFWWTRDHGGRWWDLRQIGWGRLLLGFAIFFGVGSAPLLLEGLLPQAAYQAVLIAWTLILLPSLFVLLSGLFNDRATSIPAIVRGSWPWLLVTAALLVLAFVPAQWLHQMNHRWAMGADSAAVWALMVFDSIVVGLLAGLVGTALYLGYAGFTSGARPPE